MDDGDLQLQEMNESFAIARLDANNQLPVWASEEGFLSVTRTRDELSIICREDLVPRDVRSERGWTCFELIGPFDLSITGIAIRLVRPISDAGIGFLFVTTFDTDYLLAPMAQRHAAIAALEAGGLSIGRAAVNHPTTAGAKARESRIRP
jgi:hypothetical protein